MRGNHQLLQQAIVNTATCAEQCKINNALLQQLIDAVPDRPAAEEAASTSNVGQQSEENNARLQQLLDAVSDRKAAEVPATPTSSGEIPAQMPSSESQEPFDVKCCGAWGVGKAWVEV